MMDPERIHAYLQVACSGLGFDVGEVWLTSNNSKSSPADNKPKIHICEKGHSKKCQFLQLYTSRSYDFKRCKLLSPMKKLADKLFTRRNEWDDNDDEEESRDVNRHVLSPRLVDAISRSTQVVWVNCQRQEGLLGSSEVRLQTAVGMPVAMDDNGNMCVVLMFSQNNVQNNQDAMDYLQFISKSATSLSIPCMHPVLRQQPEGESTLGQFHSPYVTKSVPSVKQCKISPLPPQEQDLGDGVIAKFVSFNLDDSELSDTPGHVPSDPPRTVLPKVAPHVVQELSQAPQDSFGIPMLPSFAEVGNFVNNDEEKQPSSPTSHASSEGAFDEASYGVWSTIMNSSATHPTTSRNSVSPLVNKAASSGHYKLDTSTESSSCLQQKPPSTSSKVKKLCILAEKRVRLEEFLSAFLEMSVFDFADVWLPSIENETLHHVTSVSTNDCEIIEEFIKVSSKTTINIWSGAIGRAYASGNSLWSSDHNEIADFGRANIFKKTKIETALAVPVFSTGDVTPIFVMCCYSLVQSDSVRFVLRFVQQALRLLWDGLDRVVPCAGIGKDIWEGVHPADLGEMAADMEMQKAFLVKKRPHGAISSPTEPSSAKPVSSKPAELPTPSGSIISSVSDDIGSGKTTTYGNAQPSSMIRGSHSNTPSVQPSNSCLNGYTNTPRALSLPGQPASTFCNAETSQVNASSGSSEDYSTRPCNSSLSSQLTASSLQPSIIPPNTPMKLPYTSDHQPGTKACNAELSHGHFVSSSAVDNKAVGAFSQPQHETFSMGPSNYTQTTNTSETISWSKHNEHNGFKTNASGTKRTMTVGPLLSCQKVSESPVSSLIHKQYTPQPLSSPLHFAPFGTDNVITHQEEQDKKPPMPLSHTNYSTAQSQTNAPAPLACSSSPNNYHYDMDEARANIMAFNALAKTNNTTTSSHLTGTGRACRQVAGAKTSPGEQVQAHNQFIHPTLIGSHVSHPGAEIRGQIHQTGIVSSGQLPSINTDSGGQSSSPVSHVNVGIGNHIYHAPAGTGGQMPFACVGIGSQIYPDPAVNSSSQLTQNSLGIASQLAYTGTEIHARSLNAGTDIAGQLPQAQGNNWNTDANVSQTDISTPLAVPTLPSGVFPDCSISNVTVCLPIGTSRAPAGTFRPGGRVCRIQGCEDFSVSRRPYCLRHSGNRLCEHEGCMKCAQGSTRFCIAHGGGRRCTFPGCDKGARDKFYCAAHGGGKRCCVEGCKKSAVGGSTKCTSHGGGRRCAVDGCEKSAQSSTNFCVKHGGGKKCATPGCGKVARGRTLYCAAHGGGVRCKLKGCTRVAIGKLQLCRSHGGGSSKATGRNDKPKLLPVSSQNTQLSPVTKMGAMQA